MRREGERMNTMVDEMDMLRQQISTHRAEIGDLRNHIAGKNRTILKQSDQIEEAEREIQRLRSLIKEEQHRTTVLQNRISRVDGATRALVEALEVEP
jgi:chromosome segregation ATPase